MEERPDHLVQFHVTVPLKEPTRPSKLMTLRVADPEYFIDFEFDDKSPITLVSAPAGCSASVARPKPLDQRRQGQAFRVLFHQSRPGTNFGFKMASTAIIACP